MIYRKGIIRRPLLAGVCRRGGGTEVRRAPALGLVQADETPWKLLQKAPSKTWYVWGLSSEHGTYYHFDPSRGTAVLRELLAGYAGVVQCDGYAAYQALARGSPEVVLAFCWAHVRRGFFEARPAYPQCERALALIGALKRLRMHLREGQPHCFSQLNGFSQHHPQHHQTAATWTPPYAGVGVFRREPLLAVAV